MRKFSNIPTIPNIKATFLWKFFIKAFLVEINHKGNFLWKFPTRWQQFLWNFFNKTEYFLGEFFYENSATLGGNFATKKRDVWWKFPQKPPNLTNFHAATLPCCRGFCDSASTCKEERGRGRKRTWFVCASCLPLDCQGGMGRWKAEKVRRGQ